MKKSVSKKHVLRLASLVLVGMLALSGLVGCGASGGSGDTGGSGGTGGSGSSTPSATATTGTINVVSREDGSGTRGAFVELFEVQIANAEGKKIDATTTSAVVTNSTSVMLTTVAGDPRAIGYISLGSLNDTVKALKIDGVEATTANVKAGTYKISRPFNIATLGTVSDATQDFINFILSADGQKVVTDDKYIAVDEKAAAFKSNGASGNVVVAGSSSVTPIMEKLKEAFAAANPSITVSIQQSDSSTGMSSAIEGICDIGMASRELKDSETGAGLTATVIAIDGIAVIANTGCSFDGLTKEQVQKVFLGEVTDWAKL